MLKMKVFKPIKSKLVPANSQVITFNWTLKNIADGRFRVRLKPRGFEQLNGVHYDSTNISSPDTNASTIRIIMVLTIIFEWVMN